jgi:alkanesulfonate monooxygenase SsuD/methylene tetrahydromethanopterin reductase-like flavin-dependent oxidoreductase (luciferase family)
MTAENALRHGMFIMPFHDPAKPLAQCYDEDLELIVRAEELGFEEFWIGEHHTMKYENIVMPPAKPSTGHARIRLARTSNTSAGSSIRASDARSTSATWPCPMPIAIWISS